MQPILPFPESQQPTVYNDHDSLISDMQLLLTDSTLCDTTILVADATPVAIPSQILSARSPYFAALLSSHWRLPNNQPLSKPNATLPVFHDLLEYLVTGAVTLSLSPVSIPHNIHLILLAHELVLEQLEATVLHHIALHLTVQNLPIYLRAILSSNTQPPQQLQQLLCIFLRDHVNAITPDLVAHDWSLMQVLWRILVNIHAQSPLPTEQVSAASRTIMAFSTFQHGKVLRAPQLIARESTQDRHLLLAFLLDAAPLTFSAVVAPASFYTDEQLLEKYRADALQPNDTPIPKKRPRWRVICESEHPYPRGARLERTARHVVVPVENEDAFYDSLLLFDKRSSLGGGAELTFYTGDPALGADPHTFLVGSSLQRELILPGREFWYAFASPDADDQVYDYLSRKWGWRFVVEPVPPVIDDID